jgi:hypothetical protein
MAQVCLGFPHKRGIALGFSEESFAWRKTSATIYEGMIYPFVV